MMTFTKLRGENIREIFAATEFKMLYLLLPYPKFKD
jgi:hypothetical protein